MAIASAFPECFSAKGVAKIVGLSPATNRIHATIWASFSSLTSSSLAYQFANQDQVFPPRKQNGPDRRTGLMEEDYEPPGILKSNWMVKHGNRIPAVVLVFHDADFESPDWPKLQEAVAAQIKSLYASAANRKTRLVSIFLRPAGSQGILLEERVTGLRSACAGVTKYTVATLNVSDPETSVQRLDGMMQDLAQQYYMDAQNSVQDLLELLNKTTEMMMAVRYNFKMGYFCELRQATNDALGFYRAAYKAIRSLPISPTRLTEIKAVAGLLNAKVCSCLFQTRLPLDALRELREHVMFYRAFGGKENERFLAEAWIAQQYLQFAQTFSDCTKYGTQFVLTQHPGFYYRLAAQHTIQRRKYFEKYCIDARLRKMKARSVPTTYFGVNEIDVEFLPEDVREPSEFRDHLFVCALEATYAHSENIIALCNAAITIFKQVYAASKQPAKPSTGATAAAKDKEAGAKDGAQKDDLQQYRVLTSINMELATEMAVIGQHEQAAKIMETAIEMYRTEPWPYLLTSCLLTSLKSAYTAGAVDVYIRRALELCGRGVTRTVAERTLAQSNLMRAIQNHEPSPEPGQRHSSEAWANAKVPVPIVINLSEIRDCIDCKFVFATHKSEAHSTLTLFVVLYSHLPLPLTFDTVRISFTSPTYKSAPLQCDGQSPDTEHALVPNSSKVLVLTFPTMASSEHVLKVKSVSVQFGDPARRVQCVWKAPAENIKTLPVMTSPTKERLESMAFDDVVPLASTTIVTKHNKMAITLEHAAPALVQEQHAVKAIIHNGESERARDVRLRIRLMDMSEPPQPLHQGTVTLLSGEHRTPSSEVVSSLGDIQTKGDVVVPFVLCFAGPLSCSLQLHVEYHAGSGLESLAVKDLSTKLECVVPFEVSFHLETLSHNKIDYIHEKLTPNQRIMLLPEVRSLVPWAVEVVRSELRLRDSDAPYPYLVGDSPDSETVLESGEVLSRCFCLALPPRVEDVPLGLFALYWRRANQSTDGATFNRTLYSLPSVALASPTLRAVLTAPCTAQVGVSLPMSFAITNYNTTIQELEASLEVNESYMCSGTLKTTIKIPPAMYDSEGVLRPSIHTLAFQLYPLNPGPSLLPAMTLMDKLSNTVVPVHGERHIFTYCRSLVQQD